MHDGEFIEHLRSRPGIYGLDGSYYPMIVFLMGFDLGRSGGLLRGFTEWLIVRKGEQTSLGWNALALEEAFPGAGIHHWGRLDPQQQKQAVDALLSLLQEFLKVRDDPRALARMYSLFQSLCADR